MMKLSALALASTLAAADAARACAAPAAGVNIQSLDCGTAGAAILWNYTQTDPNLGGSYNIAGTSLCAQAGPAVIASDGAPAIILAACDAASRAQRFNGMPDGTVVNGLTGECLDAVSGAKGPNQQLELYGCSGNDNQLYEYSPATGRITMTNWGYCVGVC